MQAQGAGRRGGQIVVDSVGFVVVGGGGVEMKWVWNVALENYLRFKIECQNNT